MLMNQHDLSNVPVDEVEPITLVSLELWKQEVESFFRDTLSELERLQSESVPTEPVSQRPTEAPSAATQKTEPARGREPSALPSTDRSPGDRLEQLKRRLAQQLNSSSESNSEDKSESFRSNRGESS